VTLKVTVLGATGSIGLSTLDILSRHNQRYQVFALTGHKNAQIMAKLVAQHQPEVVVMADADTIRAVSDLVGPSTISFLHGPHALQQVASAAEVDIVMAAIVGAAGLEPTLAAVKSSKKVLLANKEALVTAGQLFMDAVKDHKALLLPVDSEHNAIFQCLPPQFDFANPSQGIEKILLTASGGPFRTWTLEQLKGATPAQACAHPNWDMGQKISVDSASLMNKGLELIEACWLFGVGADKVEVVVHPQSIIHSMVRYNDGSILAQMGQPDMRTPIANALAWPERIDSGVAPLDFTQLSHLNFEAPDEVRFVNLRLARESFSEGHSAPVILNAANEIAVAAFLRGDIGFLDIGVLNETLLNTMQPTNIDSIEAVVAVDAQARIAAERWVGQRRGVAS
jgi:1-deoxy-D-xylulose-5-phosphate reductoisomerase